VREWVDILADLRQMELEATGRKGSGGASAMAAHAAKINAATQVTVDG
jgi:hypothetical protein